MTPSWAGYSDEHRCFVPRSFLNNGHMLLDFEESFLQGPLRDCHFRLKDGARADEVDIFVYDPDLQKASEKLGVAKKGNIPRFATKTPLEKKTKSALSKSKKAKQSKGTPKSKKEPAELPRKTTRSRSRVTPSPAAPQDATSASPTKKRVVIELLDSDDENGR